ncbi:efflux RND transporter periplasmic adaptor subunit [candidate division KSB1 bacterium]|nr:efflux RND transporter periplasmic adaptor subunit [candidate division KSB1 bacterium]
MKRAIANIILLTVIVPFMVSCSQKKSDSKSIEQLYRENGVPVRIQIVRSKQQVSEYTFFSVLTGYQESTASAKVADRVEKIYYSVGDKVAKDDIIVSFPTDNPAAQYVQAQVAYEHAKATRDRMENLYQHGGISLQDFENADTRFKVAEANWHAVRQSVKVLAPISGTITGINVRESDNVNPGDILFTVSNTSKLKAKIPVSENRIADIHRGAGATAIWNGIELYGRVVQADMSMNSRDQAFYVHMEFDNPGAKLKSGVNAEIRIESRSDSDGIVVDRKDIINRDNGRFVFVAESGIARLRRVNFVPGEGVDVFIQNGLVSGDSLIVQGQILLEDGDKINIIN